MHKIIHIKRMGVSQIQINLLFIVSLVFAGNTMVFNSKVE